MNPRISSPSQPFACRHLFALFYSILAASGLLLNEELEAGVDELNVEIEAPFSEEAYGAFDEEGGREGQCQMKGRKRSR
ncbi:hypothetical protein BDQ12DRAFT_690641 [Crucibulum laeve]|uniref:Uncharacterized protein n=1 Tax=Crucibulum laeve TaxID=68775 RepID=A0A5C3LMC4_9AGAR|nr:hypothetical protein BDQ12DRAFT_690641 [Crucibulum laeve]